MSGSEPWQSVDGLLTEARAELVRLTPAEAAERGPKLVDIRADDQRRRDGLIPGAHVISRNVLEWRLDPASPDRTQGWRPRVPIALICDEGYQSSLAAATLRRFGIDATDVDGGFQAWRAGDLPVETPD